MTATFGWPHRHIRRTGSTNAVARRLAEAGAPGGTVVTAEVQTEGRGRQGRSWIAPPGGALLYSTLLRPLGPEHGLLPLAVPVAVCEAIESLAPVSAQIKWPNDIWIGGRKACGVLIETRPAGGWAVIGVGINLAVDPEALPPQVRTRATSIGHGVEPDAARAALDEALGRWVAATAERVLGRARERDALLGREVSWDEGSGTASGIDEDGSLLVEAGSGTVALSAGEVHLRVQP